MKALRDRRKERALKSLEAWAIKKGLPIAWVRNFSQNVQVRNCTVLVEILLPWDIKPWHFRLHGPLVVAPRGFVKSWNAQWQLVPDSSVVMPDKDVVIH